MYLTVSELTWVKWTPPILTVCPLPFSHLLSMPLLQVKPTGGRNKWTRNLDSVPRAPRPLPEDAVNHGARYTTAQKIHALALMSENFSAEYVE